MARKEGTPIWITLGCGCLLLVGLVAGGIVAAGYMGVSAFKGYVEDMKDPISRAEKAGDILGSSGLPEGYTAQLFLRVPWVFDMVLLTDGQPLVIEDDHGDLDDAALGQHVFLYFELRRGRMSDAEIERMLRGEHSSDGVRADFGIEVDSEVQLASGEFDVGPQHLRYVAHRGEIEIEDEPHRGIYSLMFIDCPDDSLTRAAVWFRRDPEDLAEGTTSDVGGSPADENALSTFMAHFNVCVD